MLRKNKLPTDSESRHIKGTTRAREGRNIGYILERLNRLKKDEPNEASDAGVKPSLASLRCAIEGTASWHGTYRNDLVRCSVDHIVQLAYKGWWSFSIVHYRVRNRRGTILSRFHFFACQHCHEQKTSKNYNRGGRVEVCGGALVAGSDFQRVSTL
jgi:hypothetical protein